MLTTSDRLIAMAGAANKKSGKWSLRRANTASRFPEERQSRGLALRGSSESRLETRSTVRCRCAIEF